MCNRKRIEKEILAENPDVTVEHKCDCPLSATVEVNGVRGKKNCPVNMFCCPACIPICNEDKSAAEAKRLLAETAAPAAQDMER
eukprot:SAG31_NODE_854_length_11497_cov_8.245043_4_plen_84_part_00